MLSHPPIVLPSDPDNFQQVLSNAAASKAAWQISGPTAYDTPLKRSNQTVTKTPLSDPPTGDASHAAGQTLTTPTETADLAAGRPAGSRQRKGFSPHNEKFNDDYGYDEGEDDDYEDDDDYDYDTIYDYGYEEGLDDNRRLGGGRGRGRRIGGRLGRLGRLGRGGGRLGIGGGRGGGGLGGQGGQGGQGGGRAEGTGIYFQFFCLSLSFLFLFFLYLFHDYTNSGASISDQLIFFPYPILSFAHRPIYSRLFHPLFFHQPFLFQFTQSIHPHANE